MSILQQRLLRYLGIATLTLVLALIFMAYLQPEFMLDLGTRIALCF